MHTVFSNLSSQSRRSPEARIEGRVASVLGLTLTVTGLERALGIGARCVVHGARGPVLGEAVGKPPNWSSVESH